MPRRPPQLRSTAPVTAARLLPGKVVLLPALLPGWTVLLPGKAVPLPALLLYTTFLSTAGHYGCQGSKQGDAGR